MEYPLDVRISPKPIYRSTLRLGGTNPEGTTIQFNNYYMELNSRPFIPICGEFHYSRYPEQDWEMEISKMKMSGINVIATYIFWNHHEEIEGVFNWQGSRDIRKFTELCAQQDLYVILRIGPFCHGEVRNGGLPDWLFGRSFDVRSNDEGYLNYVRRLYQEIGEQAAGLMFKDGGPVIGIQLENEFNAAAALWELTAKQGDEYLSGGSGGKEHMRILKELAEEVGLDAPMYTSTGWGNAPILEDEILPLYGGYAYTPWSVSVENKIQKPTGEYLFADYHNDDAVNEFQPPYPKSKYPFACCEMGGGMQTWYLSRFQVEPESVVAMSLVKTAGGCNFIGYYMFHGGTNPVGSTGYLNESTTPRITYDFQAPIGEFGQIRPSNHLLRPFHYFLQTFGDVFAPMAAVLPEGTESITPENTDTLRYAVRTDGNSGFLFINNYQDHVQMSVKENVSFQITTNTGILQFPQRISLTVQRNAAMMLPFHMKLDGTNLRYATAQPVTAVQSNQAATYFFAMPEGVDGEFLFDLDTQDCINAESGEVERDPDGSAIVIVPHDETTLIRIQRAQQRELHVFVMSAAQAAMMWETTAAGNRRILFSQTPLAVIEDQLEFVMNGEEQFTFSEYVYEESLTEWKSGSESCTCAVEIKGPIVKYRLQIPSLSFPLTIQRVHDHKVVVIFDHDKLQESNDVVLNINYTGNVGYAFSNGRLIHDHFHNGAPWEIGLKRFEEFLSNGEIVLETTPLREGVMTIDADAAMAVEQHFTGEKKAVFHQITAEPVRRIKLKV
ncbi:beta-galactosidase [Paenibacillus lemnae]|uniref:Beta-galactosidase n=1 Tax=Paenibacillus lemnae TaxID=1330551 RepID=A0A848MCZ6_PAELE|nr:beta-galactosidase [Paenibacillus lemnae]NMO98061.1 hypothetical protein [Paenibacillus lemnae]